ncbi:TPT-domain-containing protein [Athelia psychrophila]|uniref:TPT-domain-containing protein n=1 Tax=Athelia psychrophila TaxID=1759441 RepID=A0A166KS72_9AGAM|nr:TPT-domain-containing protein [Fibularhizoctonia sp. CBS 109695]
MALVPDHAISQSASFEQEGSFSSNKHQASSHFSVEAEARSDIKLDEYPVKGPTVRYEPYTQGPRNRTLSYSARSKPPPPRRIPHRYNSEIESLPPFLSDASSGQASTLRAFSNPYTLNRTSTAFTPISSSKLVRRSNIYESQLFWLALYFTLNLCLTLFNKALLLRFPFPYTLTALHALCGSIGGYMLLENGFFTPARITGKEEVVLAAFSILYSVNIVVSNVSLQLVTVPFHQVVRAATPIFTIALSASLLGSMSSSGKLISMVPVIVGVALATYGDYYFTTWGLLLTLLGTFLAALKTVFTNVIQSPTLTPLSRIASRSPSSPLSFLLPPRLNLHSLDLITRMAPLAFIQCIFYAYLSGELERVRHLSAHEMTVAKAGALLVNGCLAFALNVVSFSACSRVGAVGMSVAGNVKQVLTILSAVGIFDLTITKTNAWGITLTLVGGAWYAVVEYREKRRRRWHR